MGTRRRSLVETCDSWRVRARVEATREAGYMDDSACTCLGYRPCHGVDSQLGVEHSAILALAKLVHTGSYNVEPEVSGAEGGKSRAVEQADRMGVDEAVCSAPIPPGSGHLETWVQPDCRRRQTSVSPNTGHPQASVFLDCENSHTCVCTDSA